MPPEHDDRGEDQVKAHDDETDDDTSHESILIRVPEFIPCVPVKVVDIVSRRYGEAEEGARAHCMDQPDEPNDHLLSRTYICTWGLE